MQWINTWEKTMRNEAKFQTDVKKSIEAIGGVPRKFNDFPVFKGSKTRFVPIKAYDFAVDMKNVFVAIECKFMRGFKSINKGMFLQKKDGLIINNQLNNLLEHEFCFLFINVFEPYHYNKLIILNAVHIVRLAADESFGKDALMEMHHIEFEMKKGIYDLKKWNYEIY